MVLLIILNAMNLEYTLLFLSPKIIEKFIHEIFFKQNFDFKNVQDIKIKISFKQKKDTYTDLISIIDSNIFNNELLLNL